MIIVRLFRIPVAGIQCAQEILDHQVKPDADKDSSNAQNLIILKTV